MSEPYTGEIRMVGFPYAPRGWASCDGQLMAISQNERLFVVIGGSVFGGDGRTNFALPDLRGRVPVHRRYGVGEWSEGGTGGTDQLRLLEVDARPGVPGRSMTVLSGPSESSILQPYLVVNFVIALDGTFPTRGT